MYKRVSVISALLISAISIAFVSKKQSETPNALIQIRFEKRVSAFLSGTKVLQQINDTLSEKSIPVLQAQFLWLRKEWKACEYLMEMIDPILVKDAVNGAPLPKIERNSFGLHIIEPKGLQVLDELIFSPEVLASKEEITKLSKELFETLTAFNSHLKIYDRQVFEGMRIECIRLFTLGLTGFDVPGSVNAIADAQTVVQTMYEDVLLYKAAALDKDKSLYERLENRLLAFKKYLSKHQDFESLDRLSILTDFINPIYAGLYDVQQTLGIENIDEVLAWHLLPPINLHARNLFAADFLDAQKYTAIPPKLHSPELVELGKYLFFDPILSASNDRSCASCHNPQKAFTDGLAKSVATGFQGTVERNSPTLLNVVYSERFFHDLRAEALEDQMEHVVVSSKEFNTSILEIMGKLAQSDEYQQRFKQVFVEFPNPISQQSISFAISAYVSSLRGYNSPFDKYVRGEQKQLSASAKRGFNLFMGKAACGTCHFAPNFSGTVPPLYNESESEVLGVPENPYIKPLQLDKDEGRSAARLKEAAPFYRYSFKTPTIRNAALTAPYMHNGAYRTLEDVMDFYNHGGGRGIGLEVPYQTLSSDSLHLSKEELRDVISFMQALTDTSNLTAKPLRLPLFKTQTAWNGRKVGGNY